MDKKSLLLPLMLGLSPVIAQAQPDAFSSVPAVVQAKVDQFLKCSSRPRGVGKSAREYCGAELWGIGPDRLPELQLCLTGKNMLTGGSLPSSRVKDGRQYLFVFPCSSHRYAIEVETNRRATWVALISEVLS